MRLFVALDISEDVRSKIKTFLAKLRSICEAARWVRVEGVHVTLKFIGEVSPEKAEAIKSALRTVQFPASIKMSFRGLGFFPSERRPRVLWAGVEAGPELGALAASVDAALEPLGIAREHREFSPHLTLARFESGKGLDRLKSTIAEAAPLEFGSAIAPEFHLYRSVLKRGGAEYTRLATYRSAEDKA